MQQPFQKHPFHADVLPSNIPKKGKSTFTIITVLTPPPPSTYAFNLMPRASTYLMTHTLTHTHTAQIAPKYRLIQEKIVF